MAGTEGIYFQRGEREIIMFCNNGCNSCLWIIILIIILFCCCGNNGCGCSGNNNGCGCGC